jgi:ATP-dependent Clp protease ATP-binding subunit ClpC
VPDYIYQQLRQIASREARTVASVVAELLLYALPTYRPAWIPDEHLPLLNARAKRALDLAAEEARGFNHSYFGTEHLLLGLLRDEQCAAARFLKSRGVEIDAVRTAVLRHVGRGDKPMAGELQTAPRARRSLALAVDEARSRGHERVGTEHLLLGIAREGQGIAAGILERLGVDLDQLRRRSLTGLSEHE